VSHFRAFGCRCFILKKGRLDKFESRSSDGIYIFLTSFIYLIVQCNILTYLKITKGHTH
jgi:hypothetical protein